MNSPSPRRWPAVVLVVSVALLVLLTLVAWLGRWHPWFEGIANLRLQLLMLGIVALVAAAILRHRRLAGIALLVTFIHVIYMAPYWTASPDVIEPNDELVRVMQYNIWFGNENYSAIAGRINQSEVDIVSVQELTDSQWAELEPLLTEHSHRVALPVSDDIGELGGGMALLSRQPLLEVPLDDPSNLRDRPIMSYRTEVAGQSVVVVALHPHASRFESAKVDLRTAQLNAIAALANGTDLPMVLITDMNMTPFSSEYRSFLRDTGWRDPHQLVGWNATWPTALGPLGLPLDHIFVSNDMELHDYEVGSGAGSDHRTLIATVSFSDE